MFQRILIYLIRILIYGFTYIRLIQEINISPTRLALQLVLVFVVTRFIVWHYEQYGQSNYFQMPNTHSQLLVLAQFNNFSC